MCTFPSFAETIGGFPKGALLHSRFKDNILSLVKNHRQLSTSCAHVYVVYTYIANSENLFTFKKITVGFEEATTISLQFCTEVVA